METVNKQFRLKFLIEKIMNEFPSHEINYESEITVTRPQSFAQKRDHRIRFSPSEELLNDEDSDFIGRFNEGVRLARRILDEPPFEEKIYQGDIVMKNDSVTFEQRTE